MKIESSVMHLYMYGVLRRTYGSQPLHISKLREKLALMTRLPRKYHFNFVQEMVELKLLRKINRDNYALIYDLHVKPLTDYWDDPLWPRT